MGICSCGHECDCKCGCNPLQSCQCGPKCKCQCPCAKCAATPDKIASDLRTIADMIDRSKRPDVHLVQASIRQVIATVESPGIMSKKPQMDQAFLKVVLEQLDFDDSHATELVAVEDLVAQAVYDATTELAQSLAELETEYGYKFNWLDSDEEAPEPDLSAGPGVSDAPEPEDD